MKITATNFRDNAIKEITLGYDWDNSENYALIKIIEADKTIKNYRISGLKESKIYEDFQAMYIEQCTLVINPNGLYLCLDPFNENEELRDKDNLYFYGKSIECQ